jgi:arabinogalactan oligomer/maltooligosaccharide transport system substrate-binding protein
MRRFGVKKLVASLAVTSLAVGLLAGCGSSASSSNDNGSGGGSKKEPVALTVWTHFGDDELKPVQKAADEWAKETGNTVKVTFDKGPDIMFGIAHDNLGTFQRAGLLAEVPNGFINPDDYVKVGMDAVTIQGKDYAIPLSMESVALFYNTDKVKTPPTTWDDFITQAQANGFSYDINNFYHSFNFIGGEGGYVFKDNNGTLDPNDIGLANEGAVKGFQIISDFVNKYKFMHSDIKGDIALKNFQTGKTAFYISGPWDVQGLQKAGLKFAIAPLPSLPDGKTATPFVGIQSAFVSSKSKHQQEAWDLMKYLVAHTSDGLLQAGHRIPVLKSKLDDPSVKNDPIISKFASIAQTGVPMPNIPEMQAVWAPAGNALTLVTSNKQQPQTAAQKMVDQIKQGEAALK